MHVQQFSYIPYYCEENIYKLCEALTGVDGYNKELFAIFISNDERKVRSLPGAHFSWDALRKVTHAEGFRASGHGCSSHMCVKNPV